MKKLVAFFTLFAVTFAFAGCSNDGWNEKRLRFKFDNAAYLLINNGKPENAVKITDQDILRTYADEFRSHKYVKTAKASNADYYYEFEWYDGDDQKIESLCITEENGYKIRYNGEDYKIGADLNIKQELLSGVEGLFANSDEIQLKSFPLSSDEWNSAKTIAQNHFVPSPELERLPASRVGETLVDKTLPTGQRIVLFHPTERPDEFTKCWAVDRGDIMEVFCVETTGYERNYGVDTYENVLGHDGFRIHGPRGSSYDYYDYWYFDENDTPVFLAEGSNFLYETDLNGDGTKELLSLYGCRANYTYAETDSVYDVDLIDLTGNIDGWIIGEIDFDFEHAGAHRLPQTDGRECLPLLLRQPDGWEQPRKATLFFSADGIDLAA